MTVTLKDIARVAGVTHPTVSRALRNHPRIGAETRARIQALAAEMGYRPDPVLTALAAYRSGKQPRHRYGNIAILCHRSEAQGLPAHLDEIVVGIRERANELGFQADVFQMLEDEREQQRLNRILYHRGIRGVIILPLPWKPTAFDWSRFAVVGTAENAVPLRLNYVSYDHDAAVRETYLQIRSFGYRNIGFINARDSEERNRFLFVSAYLKCRFLDGLPIVPPCLISSHHPPPIAWLRKHRFDAVIAPANFVREFAEAGIRVPEQLGVAGFASPEKPSGSRRVASYVIDGRRLGAATMNFTQTLLHQNQLGVPEPGRHYAILIRGYWRDGPTLARVDPSKNRRARRSRRRFA
jgi:DNA-binding LacI/PurR family transcriptional regulator